MLKNRDKLATDPVGLAAVMKIDIVRREFPVHRDVAGCTGWRNPKASGKIWTANLPHEIQAKLKVGESFALSLAQARDTLRMRSHSRLIHGKQQNDPTRTVFCSLFTQYLIKLIRSYNGLFPHAIYFRFEFEHNRADWSVQTEQTSGERRHNVQFRTKGNFTHI
jgi:hypothetical protein